MSAQGVRALLSLLGQTALPAVALDVPQLAAADYNVAAICGGVALGRRLGQTVSFSVQLGPADHPMAWPVGLPYMPVCGQLIARTDLTDQVWPLRTEADAIELIKKMRRAFGGDMERLRLIARVIESGLEFVQPQSSDGYVIAAVVRSGRQVDVALGAPLAGASRAGGTVEAYSELPALTRPGNTPLDLIVRKALQLGGEAHMVAADVVLEARPGGLTRSYLPSSAGCLLVSARA